MTAPSFQDADDRTLMAAVAERNAEAFHHIYRRHSGLVYAVARRITGGDHDAQDVVAEVFWELWEKSERYSPSKSAPQAYIVMLARCRALDRKRGLARQTTHPLLEWLAEESPTAADRTPESALASSEQRAHVVEAIEQLDANQREAIELTFYDGLTHQATAERLGIPLGTLKGRIRSALHKLRKSLLQFNYD